VGAGPNTPQRLVKHTKPVLASADGMAGKAICAAVGGPRTIGCVWMNRYEAAGRDAMVADRPRSGRPRQLDATAEARIVAKTLDEAPPDGGTPWSTRLMAKETGCDTIRLDGVNHIDSRESPQNERHPGIRPLVCRTSC